MSIFPRSLFIFGVVFMFLAGCGEEEEEQHPYPGELINGTWAGSLISENTGKERSFEAILCYGEDPDILPPYYYDLLEIWRSSKITDVNTTPVGVHGVFKIRSDDQVDTLVAQTGGFSFEWGLNMELKADGFIKYWLTNGMISDDTVEGSYKEFRRENGHHPQVDAGIWTGIRTVKENPYRDPRKEGKLQ